MLSTLCGMLSILYGNKWQRRERIAVVSYVRMRTRQTESVHVAIQNVSTHESDKIFQGVTSLQTCFPNFQKWRTVLVGNIVAFYICHRRLKYTVAETTNISSRSCRRRRTSPHPAVVHELDVCTHHIDSVFNYVNPPTLRFLFFNTQTLPQL